jgi:hypothetical protein
MGSIAVTDVYLKAAAERLVEISSPARRPAART